MPEQAMKKDVEAIQRIHPGLHGRVAYFAAIDGVRFRRRVVPGDQLMVRVDLIKRRGRLIRVQAEARVEGQEVAKGTLTFLFASPAEEIEMAISTVDSDAGAR